MPSLAEEVPDGHSKQVVAPRVGAYRPRMHNSHDVQRVSDHLPAAHGEHVRLFAAVALKNDPAGQCTKVRLPSGQMAPAGHASHDVAPTLGWYRPTAHGLHSAVPLTELNEPAGHCEHSVAPAILKVPAGHK
jgi:hypothetical protein